MVLCPDVDSQLEASLVILYARLPREEGKEMEKERNKRRRKMRRNRSPLEKKGINEGKRTIGVHVYRKRRKMRNHAE